MKRECACERKACGVRCAQHARRARRAACGSLVYLEQGVCWSREGRGVRVSRVDLEQGAGGVIRFPGRMCREKKVPMRTQKSGP